MTICPITGTDLRNRCQQTQCYWHSVKPEQGSGCWHGEAITTTVWAQHKGLSAEAARAVSRKNKDTETLLQITVLLVGLQQFVTPEQPYPEALRLWTEWGRKKPLKWLQPTVEQFTAMLNPHNLNNYASLRLQPDKHKRLLKWLAGGLPGLLQQYQIIHQNRKQYGI